MNISHLRRKIFLTILCCVILVGAVGMTQAGNNPSWWVSLWNWITGMKDTVEGITALISALETDIEEANDEIARIENRKSGHLTARNNVKERIQPKEQEQKDERRKADAALEAYNAASVEAAEFRKEIAEIEAKLRWLSASHSSYADLMTALYFKTSGLSLAENKMSEEKDKHNKAKRRVRSIELELEGDRGYIDYLTGLIDRCDKDIKALNEKIAKKQAKIDAETKRRADIREKIKKEEAKWEELNKESKTPEGQQI